MLDGSMEGLPHHHVAKKACQTWHISFSDLNVSINNGMNHLTTVLSYAMLEAMIAFLC